MEVAMKKIQKEKREKKYDPTLYKTTDQYRIQLVAKQEYVSYLAKMEAMRQECEEFKAPLEQVHMHAPEDSRDIIKALIRLPFDCIKHLLGYLSFYDFVPAGAMPSFYRTLSPSGKLGMWRTSSNMSRRFEIQFRFFVRSLGMNPRKSLVCAPHGLKSGSFGRRGRPGILHDNFHNYGLDDRPSNSSVTSRFRIMSESATWLTLVGNNGVKAAWKKKNAIEKRMNIEANRVNQLNEVGIPPCSKVIVHIDAESPCCDPTCCEEGYTKFVSGHKVIPGFREHQKETRKLARQRERDRKSLGKTEREKIRDEKRRLKLIKELEILEKKRGRERVESESESEEEKASSGSDEDDEDDDEEITPLKKRHRNSDPDETEDENETDDEDAHAQRD
jgi:hypothetical protein